MTIGPGPRRGRVVAPPSKSHAHRLLIADFLAGDLSRLSPNAADSADVAATKRCLAALAQETAEPVLDCGESGSTLRFIAPVAAALGKRPIYRKAGRLAERPVKEYPVIAPGVHELPGNVSSQFVTGLLFALPVLDGDSRIRFTSPLESRGYVDMTLAVVRGAGVEVDEVEDGFLVRGRQKFRPQPSVSVEGDWSGAAFWLAMNALGGSIDVAGLSERSAQPDMAVAELLADMPGEIDVSQCPDIFPVLSVVAASRRRETSFKGIRRLRIKECDRVAAMGEVLSRFGAGVEVSEGEFLVHGVGGAFRGGLFPSFGDHRIAMAVAVGATCADSLVEIDDAACAAKSYPSFFAELSRMEFADGAAFGGAQVLAAVSLGSNVEPRADYMRRALAALDGLPRTRLVAASSVNETEPVDVPPQYARLKFLNQAALLRTSLGPMEFSKLMHGIEDSLGRVRTTKNGPRTIDIDLVDFGGIAMDSPTLTLPHPRARIRDFVLGPLAELGFALP